MDKEFLEELFQPFAPVAIRRMFGGQGISLHGLNFAIVVDGALCLKADEETQSEFEAENMAPWTYQRKDGKILQMGYWQVPERLFDEPEEFAVWAEKAFEVAKRLYAAKPAKQRKLKQL